ncbi:MAG: Smr/MutS family protein [Pseudomonadota bacterium]
MKRKPPILDEPIKKYRLLSDAEKDLWHKTITKNLDNEPEEIKEIKEVKVEKNPITKSLKKNTKAIPSLINIKAINKIEASFDLHGHTLKNAYSALHKFIISAHSKNIRTVLVITGKGKIQGNNTIRSQLPYWLQETELKNYVTSFSQAAVKHGGTGAWYIKISKL